MGIAEPCSAIRRRWYNAVAFENGERMSITSSLLSLIGNTPMVRLNRVARDVEAEVLVKIEYLNPSGSIKDRIALRMIEDAERAGILRPGMEIVEGSTGNTATALAFVGAIKGYKVHLFIPTNAASEERLRIMKAYGAVVTLVDVPAGWSPGPSTGALHGSIVEKTPRQMCLDLEKSRSDVWWARQFSNPSNVAAHADGTGKEILEQTGGKLDAFVAAIGTCGTLIGVAKTLRANDPGVRIVAVEPQDQPVIKDGKLVAEATDTNINIAGGLLKEMVDSKVADRVIQVSQDDAIAMAHRLSEEEGFFCGLSSGANVFAALQIARELGKGHRVVTVLVDSRDRYLFKEKFTT
jgi:cysteine synthase A